MSIPLLDPTYQKLLQTRLQQAVDSLRSLTLTTRQEALASVYSAINKAMALGNRMTPLTVLAASTPARFDDVVKNFEHLSRDGQAILSEIASLESQLAQMFNLFASVQNTLRQDIRERVFTSSSASFQEQFLNLTNISKASATIDFQAALARLPVLKTTTVPPVSIRSGLSSVGNLSSDSSFDYLVDGVDTTQMLWNGDVLELILDFDSAQIVNRLQIDLVNFQGLTLEQWTCSPDGIAQNDILGRLSAGAKILDASSGKYSGDWVADFEPQFVQTMRLVFHDRSGTSQIRLRRLTCSQIQADSSGSVDSKAISNLTGVVSLQTEELTSPQLTTLTHQVSTDGVHYTTCTPGDVLDVGQGPFWYRTLFNRIDKNFGTGVPLLPPTTNADSSLSYELGDSSATSIGGNLLQRSIGFQTVSGPITLLEAPLPGSLEVYQNGLPLSASGYNWENQILSFSSPVSGILVQYRTSVFNQSGLSALRPYYTPILHSVRFVKS